jgi:hypothetical protein
MSLKGVAIMILKEFKILLIALIFPVTGWAQAPGAPSSPDTLVAPKQERLSVVVKGDLETALKELEVTLDGIDVILDRELERLPRHLEIACAEVLEELDNMGIEVKVNSKRSGKGITVEKVKKISKSYTVNQNDKLSLNNQYGKIAINVWSKNEIKVDIEIKAFESSDQRAEELLEGVDIDESKTGNLISFKTNIERNSNKLGMLVTGGQKRGLEVNYTVYMPESNPLDLVNRFGSVSLPDYAGALNLRISYGSLKAGLLTHQNNAIDIKYGSAAISSYSSGAIDVSYGSLAIDHASNIAAEVRYGSTKIGKLSTGGSIENKYGSLRVGELEGIVKPLTITTDKGSVALGVKPSANFDFDVTVHMGGFHFPDGRVNLLSKTPDNERGPTFTKSYRGKYGKGSEAIVQIRSNYGSVKFQ